MTDSSNYSSEEMKRYFNDPEYRRMLLERSKSFFRRNKRYFLLAGAVVLLLLGIYISHRLAGPLFALSRRMRELSQGDFNALLSLRTTDEFQDLKEDYNVVVRSLQNRLKEDLLKLSQSINQLTTEMAALEKEAISPRLLEPLQSSISSLQTLYDHKNKLLQPSETFKPTRSPEEVIL